MPTLTWAGKDEALNVAKSVSYRLLEQDSSLSYGDFNAGNMIIQGDNLAALKSLLPYYRGMVRCIYIDPPYNTGAAFEHYDDNVSHATWLSLLYPRLELLRELLSEEGFLCCEIDDSESHYLKLLLDEIFGRNNYLTTMYVKVRYPDKTLKEDMTFHKEIEQIFVYRKTNKAIPFLDSIDVGYDKFIYKITEKTKPFKEEILGGKRVEIFKKDQYEIIEENGSKNGLKEIWATGTILDGNSSGRFFRDFLNGRYEKDGYGVLYKVYGIGDDLLDYRYFTGPKREGATKGKYYQGVPKDKIDLEKILKNKPIENSYDFAANFGNCRQEGGVGFRSGKKPEALLQLILHHFSNPGDIVLDSFLGSGTTAAVAQKMNRRYIGIEIGEHAVTHVVPRLKKVIDGEEGGISKAENWQGGGGFSFFRLGKEIFTADGRIQKGVDFKTLAAHIWMEATRTPYKSKDTANSPLLGVYKDTAYYLLYNGILGDKRPQGGNVLTKKILSILPPYNGLRIIYGESSRIRPENLKAMNIIFRQTPKEIPAN